jgi:hypothetical protein
MQPRLGYGGGDVGRSHGDGVGCCVVESKLHHDGIRVLPVRAYDPTDTQLTEGVDGSLIGRGRARARGDGVGASDQPMGPWREERGVEGGERKERKERSSDLMAEEETGGVKGVGENLPNRFSKHS